MIKQVLNESYHAMIKHGIDYVTSTLSQVTGTLSIQDWGGHPDNSKLDTDGQYGFCGWLKFYEPLVTHDGRVLDDEGLLVVCMYFDPESVLEHLGDDVNDREFMIKETQMLANHFKQSLKNAVSPN